MLTRRLIQLTVILAVLSSATLPLSARADSPHEKLKKFLFGDDDNKKKKKKKKDDDYYYDRRRHSCYDHNHNGYCDVCSRRLVVVETRPVIEIRRSYPDRYYESAPYYEDRRPVEVDVQLELRRRGYYRGPIDGDIGPGSRRAIYEYQYDHDLPTTGRIDRYLLRSLDLI